MICGKCQHEIVSGEPYSAHPIESCSGPGATAYLHLVCPAPRTRR